MLSYEQLINQNKAFADAHYVIKNFGNGERWQIVDHYQQPSFKYPLMYVEDGSHSSNDGQFIFSLKVWFVTRIEAPKNRNGEILYSEYAKAKSDMIQCAKDLVSFWVQDMNNPTMELDKSVSIETFIDYDRDEFTGCSLTINFIDGFDYDNCILPMDGVPTPPDPCKPVLIYEDGVLVDTVASGGSYSYTTTSDPAGNTMNGTSLTDIVSGTTKAFTIRYEDDSPVTVTTISDNATAFIGEVPNTTVPTVTPNRPQLTQSVAAYDYDEKWHIDNGTFDITYPTTPQIQQTDFDGSEKIKFSDVGITGINHLFRFVGQYGGYYNELDGNYYDIDGALSDRDTEFETNFGEFYIIDRLNWVGWHGIRGGSSALDFHLSLSPYTKGGFSDMYLPPVTYYRQIMRPDIAQPLYLIGRPPFDIQLQPWSCTYYGGTTTSAWYHSSGGNLQATTQTTSRQASFMRPHEWGVDDFIVLGLRWDWDINFQSFGASIQRVTASGNATAWTVLETYTTNIKGTLVSGPFTNAWFGVAPTGTTKDANTWLLGYNCGATSGNFVVYELGVNVFTGGVASLSDTFEVRFDGANYQYYHNDVLQYTGAAVSGGAGSNHFLTSMQQTPNTVMTATNFG